MSVVQKTSLTFFGLFAAAAAISGCAGRSASQSPYAGLCKSSVSGIQLVSISPDQGTQFGDQQVTAVIKAAGVSFTPALVFLGNKARGVTVTAQAGNELSISFTTAGTPTAGTYPLVIATGMSACAYLPNAYRYNPPVSGAFRTFVGYGASGTAGFQSDSYNEAAQLNGPAAWIARQAGAYFPIPLFRMPGIPPAPGFDALGTDGRFTGTATALVSYLAGAKSLPALFEDPDIVPYNIAIPGATVEDEVLGPASTTSMAIPVIALSNLLFAPYDNSLFEKTDIKPEIQMVKDLHPTLVMSMDLYINDLITNEVATSYDTFVTYITQDVAALASTGAQVFLADVPHAVLLLPSSQEPALGELMKCGMTFSDISGGIFALDQAADADSCAATFSNGTFTFTGSTCAYNACETLVSMDQKVDQFNSEFETVAAQYPNVQVVSLSGMLSGKVPVAGQYMTIDAQGFPEYTIGNVTVKMKHLGGFSSLDDAHPTNTGYAMIASLFVQAINARLGTNIPLPDLGSVLAEDPLSPPALETYCSQSINSQKPYCMCIENNYSSVTPLTCTTLLY